MTVFGWLKIAFGGLKSGIGFMFDWSCGVLFVDVEGVCIWFESYSVDKTRADILAGLVELRGCV